MNEAFNGQAGTLKFAEQNEIKLCFMNVTFLLVPPRRIYGIEKYINIIYINFSHFLIKLLTHHRYSSDCILGVWPIFQSSICNNLNYNYLSVKLDGSK